MPSIDRHPSAFTSTTGFDGNWTNPGNAYSNDNTNYATCAPGRNAEFATNWRGFDFSAIPDGSTINSVTVHNDVKVSTAWSQGSFLGSVWADVTASAALAPGVTGSIGNTQYSQSTAAWPTSDTDWSYALTTLPTDAQLKGTNFGVRFEMAKGNNGTTYTVSLDDIYITVDYTAPATNVVAQAQAQIKSFNNRVYAQAQVQIASSGGPSTYSLYGQARVKVILSGRYPSAVMADSPTAYYRMNEASGYPQDSSGNGNHATTSGGASIVYSQSGALLGDSNNAIDFEDDYFGVPYTAFQLGDTWTVEAWVKRDDLNTQSFYYWFGNRPGSGNGWFIGVNSTGQLFLYIYYNAGASSQTIYTSTQTIEDTNWHHVVITKSGATTIGYIDGKAATKASGTDYTLPSDYTTDWGLGNSGAYEGSSGMRGLVDEIAVWAGTAISAGSVAAHYEAARSVFANAQALTKIGNTYPLAVSYSDAVLADFPAAYYRLGEPSGTNANDEANNYDGTYTNSPSLGQTGALYNDTDTAVNFTTGTFVQLTDTAALEPGSSFTLELWVKRNTIQDNTNFYSKGTGGNFYGMANGTFRLGNDGGTVATSTSTALGDNNWHYIVVTYAGTGAGNTLIYIDGVEGHTDGPQISVGLSANASNPRIGDYISGGEPSLAVIDEVAIYNKVLTASQVLEHYQVGKTKTIGPTFAQAQAQIIEAGATTYRSYAQAQVQIAAIITIYRGYAQAQVQVKIPIISIVAYRGRNDDGSETTATWKKPEVTDFALSPDVTFRVRYEVQESANVPLPDVSAVWQLQVKKNAGSYQDVNATSTIVKSVSSAFVADTTATTDQLTYGTGTFRTGEVDANNGRAGNAVFSGNDHSEYEYTIQIVGADVQTYDTLTFQIIQSSVATTPPVIAVVNTQQLSITVNGVLTQKYAQAQAQIAGALTVRGFAQANTAIGGSYTSVTDSFTRTIADGLGDADTGGTYTIYGTAANWDTDGSKATVSTSVGVGNYNLAILPKVALSTIGGSIEYSIASLPETDTVLYFNISIDRAATSKTTWPFSQTGPYVAIYSDGSASINNSFLGSAIGTAFSAGTFVAGETWILTFVYLKNSSGFTFKSKTYKSGTTEPGWQKVSTLSDYGAAENYKQYAGHVGLLVGQEGDGTQARVLTLDNWNLFVVGTDASAQAQAKISKYITYISYAQAQVQVKQTYRGYAQANVWVKQTYRGYAQANAWIEQTYRGYAQAQTWIEATYRGYAQAQVWIKTTYRSYAQANTWIEQTYRSYAQANTWIEATYQAYANAQTRIKQAYQAYGQSNTWIEATYRGYAQANVWIEATYNTFANAQTQIKQSYQAYAQALATIKQAYQAYTNAQAQIRQSYQAYANALAQIKTSYLVYAQAQVAIENTYQAYGQAEVSIYKPVTTYTEYAQALAQIKQTYQVHAQAQAQIKQVYRGYGQAQAWIESTYRGYAQALATIEQTYQVYAQANVLIKNIYQVYAQSLALIRNSYLAYAQAQAAIENTYQFYGQAQTLIVAAYRGYANAQAAIEAAYNAYAQSQAKINAFNVQVYGQALAYIAGQEAAYAQAQAQIKTSYMAYANAQATIKQAYQAYAQAGAWIEQAYLVYAQAQARIKQTYQVYAQAQTIIEQTYQVYAQAQAQIKRAYQAYAQAQVQVEATYQAYAQAQAQIKVTYQGYGQSAALIVVKDIRVYAQAGATIFATGNAFGQAEVEIYIPQIARPISDISNNGWVRTVRD